MSPYPNGSGGGYPGMTIAYLPGPSDAVSLYEPWAGEPEVLAEAAGAGRRAAAWIRSLPAPPSPSPVGTWLARTLPHAVESAMGSLNRPCSRIAAATRHVALSSYARLRSRCWRAAKSACAVSMASGYAWVFSCSASAR